MFLRLDVCKEGQELARLLVRAPPLEDAVNTPCESDGHCPRHCCLHHFVSLGASCFATSTFITCARERLANLYARHAKNDSSSQDFYNRTVAALEKKQASDREVAQKLQDIKDAARAQGAILPTTPQKPIAVSIEDEKPVEGKVSTSTNGQDSATLQMGKGDDDARSVAGRKTMLRGGEIKDLHSGKEAPIAVEREKEKYPAGKKIEKQEKAESKEDHEVETELNLILKKGPSTSNSKPCT